ncbi:MAG: tyrosine phenol-lyase [Ignavibacteriales bacterium CG07_land_8_20_14_0_80_59_12]|nr:MAG: tyrosine phenol-lyase [Ignavibacteriales bacterium CG07_land_8_20_14_0_80_59_12]
MRTIIEPFKIKSVEPIPMTTPEDRHEILRASGYNTFLIKAEHVTIDLLTDSGTGAMSAKQWACILDGDESYAGARSFYRLESAARNLFGFKHIIPTHQGRAAERILFSILGGSGKTIPNNTHFDTTRANIELPGGEAVDLPVEEGRHPELIYDFKGNMDVDALRHLVVSRGPSNVPLIMLTVTNNSGGGQPVSMGNIRAVSEVAKEFGIPLFLDACRFAENAYFIKKRESGYGSRSIIEIVREMFSYSDGCTFSAKKDALVNIGGLLCMNDDDLATKAKNLLVITEGFPTYGGLAGRDLEAVAQGLEEGVNERYLEYRLRSVEYLGEKLLSQGVPILLPTGGHAVYLDSRRFVPQIPQEEFPGQSIVVELYHVGGVRAVEIGSVMFGKYDSQGKFIPPILDLVRLAIPRRVYTQSHIDYVAEAVGEVYLARERLGGYRITYQPPLLRHFTARFEPV